jgi:hypothetical protein
MRLAAQIDSAHPDCPMQLSRTVLISNHFSVLGRAGARRARLPGGWAVDRQLELAGRGERFYSTLLPALHIPPDLRKRDWVMFAVTTLSAICTCPRAPAPPIPRTATYRRVQLPKTAGRSPSIAECTGAAKTARGPLTQKPPQRPECSSTQPAGFQNSAMGAELGFTRPARTR